MTRVRLALPLAVLLAAGCLSSSPSTPAGNTPQPEVPGVAQPPGGQLVFAESEEGLDGTTVTHVNFGSLRDLWFRLKVTAMPALSKLTVKLFTPQQQLFYQDTFAFSSDPKVKKMAMPAGNPPKGVITAKPIAGGFALDYQVPVAGTIFQKYPQTGSWQVSVVLDGMAGTISAPLDVEMTR